MEPHRRTVVNEVLQGGHGFAGGAAHGGHQLNGHKPVALDAVAFRTASERILSAINTVIDGKAEAAKLALTVLLAQGHLLLEDVPGVGKTLLAKTLARTIDCPSAASSSPRICSPRTSPASPSTTRPRASSSSGPAPCLRTS